MDFDVDIVKRILSKDISQYLTKTLKTPQDYALELSEDNDNPVHTEVEHKIEDLQTRLSKYIFPDRYKKGIKKLKIKNE